MPPSAIRLCRRRTRRALDYNRERELLLRYQAGDRRAGEALLEFHAGFVHSFVRERENLLPDGFQEDLLQEARMALLRAAGKWDPARSNRFLSFAVFDLRAAVSKFVMENTSLIRGFKRAEDRSDFFRLRRQMTAALTGEDVDWKPGEYESALRTQPLLSLDALLKGDREDSSTFAYATPDPRPGAEERLAEHSEHQDRSRRFWAAVEDLSSRDRALLRRRFLAEEPETLEELTAEFALTREGVRQAQFRALEKLCAALQLDYATVRTRLVAYGYLSSCNAPKRSLKRKKAC